MKKIPHYQKYPLAIIQVAQNLNQTNTGSSAKLLQIEIGAKVMWTGNLDIQDRLTNGQTENIQQTEFVQGGV